MIKYDKEKERWVEVGNVENCSMSFEIGDTVEILYVNGYKKTFAKPKGKPAVKTTQVKQPPKD